MEIVLFAAAALTVLIGIAHSWLGDTQLIQPVLKLDTGILRVPVERQTLHVAWHITTVAWFAIAGTLVILAFGPLDATGRAILGMLAAAMLLTGAMMLAWTRGRHPAWAVFFAIAGLSAWPLL